MLQDLNNLFNKKTRTDYSNNPLIDSCITRISDNNCTPVLANCLACNKITSLQQHPDLSLIRTQEHVINYPYWILTQQVTEHNFTLIVQLNSSW